MSGGLASLLLVVGLTGVGKSTVVDMLLARRSEIRLLPNRRDVTDRIIFPEVQRRHGVPVAPVRDRLERFRLTAAYREVHPGGMTHALSRWLAENGPDARPGELLLFDNLRGLEEVRAATEVFPDARFLVLDAPPMTRLARLVGRADPFDRVETGAPAEPALRHADLERFRGVPNVDDVFDAEALARIAARDALDVEAVVTAARIIVEEQRNYDSAAATEYLEAHVPSERLCIVDTAALGPDDVAARVDRWLGRGGDT